MMIKVLFFGGLVGAGTMMNLAGVELFGGHPGYLLLGYAFGGLVTWGIVASKRADPPRDGREGK